MKSMRKVFAVVGAAALYLTSPVRSEAATLYVDLDSAAGVQASKVIGVGGSVTADIWISGLAASIGSFDIDLSFNVGGPNVVGTVGAFNAATQVDPDGNFANDFGGTLSCGYATRPACTPSSNIMNIFESGDPANANAGPFPAAFRLGTINLAGLILGQSLLRITFEDVSDAGGNVLVGNTTQDAFVCVVENPTAPTVCPAAAVPEPGLLALLGAGVSALAARRRRLALRA